MRIPDARFEYHGSLYLLRLLTHSAEEWVELNVSDDATYFGDALVVEPRYAHTLRDGMVEHGLVVV